MRPVYPPAGAGGVAERGDPRPAAWLGRMGSFGIAACATFALTANTFVPSFHAARLGGVLAALMAVHLIRFPRFMFPREAVLYACFLGYMLLELVWSPDVELALNTLLPAADFLLIIALFCSLVAIHEPKAVLAGVVGGFAAGAAVYTAVSGFPLRYPEDFSYNAVATMYLFGFVSILLLASLSRRPGPLLALAAVVAALIVATTSIKTNLGILLGALVAAAFHFRRAAQMVARNALLIAVAVAAVAVGVGTNDAAMKALHRGADRVELGVQILLARENLPGYSAFERRVGWQQEGFRGWAANPVFGYGVEAFRDRFGITSHASHVDIAYNSGLIGLALFYGMFASALVRLYRARGTGMPAARLVALAFVSCFVFVSFAGTFHYNAFLGAFIGLAVGIVKRAVAGGAAERS